MDCVLGAVDASKGREGNRLLVPRVFVGDVCLQGGGSAPVVNPDYLHGLCPPPWWRLLLLPDHKTPPTPLTALDSTVYSISGLEALY
jgi:hypothetical protein